MFVWTMVDSFLGSIQAPKKGINIEKFDRNPPPKTPPPSNGPLTPQMLFIWGLFPSKCRKYAKRKAFRGLGAPKFFMLKFFACFRCT